MKRLIYLIACVWMLAFLSLMIGCDKNPADPESELEIIKDSSKFIPLKVGNWWKYRSMQVHLEWEKFEIIEKFSDTEWLVEVTDDITDTSYHKEYEKWKWEPPYLTIVEGRDWYYQVGWSEWGRSDYWFKFKFPTKKGEKWQMQVPNINSYFDVETICVNCNFDPGDYYANPVWGSKFSDCIRYDHQVYGTESYFVKPGIGIVNHGVGYIIGYHLEE